MPTLTSVNLSGRLSDVEQTWSLTYLASSGVYAIRNTKTKCVYIGSSALVGNRIMTHLRLLRTGNHSYGALQADFDREGPAGFEIQLLATCKPDELINIEQEMIEQARTRGERVYNYPPQKRQRNP